jgi:acetyltransferase-like isoleucine patch superfamily enzyme
MLREIVSAISARARLRACARVGRLAQVRGRVWIHGAGVVCIGDRVHIDARQAPVELHAGPGARLVIGDDVTIGSGASIEAMQSVTIGDRAKVGGFARIMDNHFHRVVGDRLETPESAPVHVGSDASIGWRAIILPGTTVTPGTVIRPGSTARSKLAARAAPMDQPPRGRT